MASGVTNYMRNIRKPAPEIISEQPYANNWERRHFRTTTGHVGNIPKEYRLPAQNVPYRKPVEEDK